MTDTELLDLFADLAKHVYHKPFVADALATLAKNMAAEEVAKREEGSTGVCC